MSPQLDYNDQNSIPAVKGAISDSAFHDLVESKADVDIGFGFGLVLTAVQNKVALPSAAGQRFAGVAVQTEEGTSRATGVAVHESDSSFPVLKKGRIWVDSDQAVNPTLPVYFRFSGKKQVQTIVLDADLVVSNTVDGSIGGSAIAQVTFTTTHVNTMGLVASAILAANSNILSAVVGGAGDRTITIITNQDILDQDLGGDWVVLAGASQANITESETHQSVNTSEIGNFRADDDIDETATATAELILAGKWGSTTAGPELAILKLNSP